MRQNIVSFYDTINNKQVYSIYKLYIHIVTVLLGIQYSIEKSNSLLIVPHLLFYFIYFLINKTSELSM